MNLIFGALLAKFISCGIILFIGYLLGCFIQSCIVYLSNLIPSRKTLNSLVEENARLNNLVSYPMYLIEAPSNKVHSLQRAIRDLESKCCRLSRRNIRLKKRIEGDGDHIQILLEENSELGVINERQSDELKKARKRIVSHIMEFDSVVQQCEQEKFEEIRKYEIENLVNSECMEVE